MKYEVVNKKDGTRMSHVARKGCSTLFDSEKAAMEWMLANNLSSLEYTAKEAVSGNDE